jgi:hypothetical protein
VIQETLFNEPQRGYGRDDYWTPKWLFDALGLEFDLDVACPPEGPMHTPCKSYYTQETNGLTSDWRGLVWMNPPYSKPDPWVTKWVEHGNGLALLPCSNGLWFFNLWHNEQVSCINIRPQDKKLLKFETPEGKSTSIFMPTMLWAIGEIAISSLNNSGLGKVR